MKCNKQFLRTAEADKLKNMDTDKILENNKMIADFMGGKIAHFNITNTPHYRNLPHGRTILLEDLKYHFDWNWLMPVVEKIETLGLFNVTITTPFIKIKMFNNPDISIIGLPPAKSKVEAVWLAVVEFIEWHNKYTYRRKPNSTYVG